jgi:hypothetical protein
MDTMGSRCGFARCLPGFNDLYMVSCLPLRQNAIVDAARTIDSGTSPRLRQIREGLFAPHADLLHGHDGGMNKTGTMDGIRTLAGYADTSSHGRVRFVISLTSNDDEMRFRLLRAIESGL